MERDGQSLPPGEGEGGADGDALQQPVSSVPPGCLSFQEGTGSENEKWVGAEELDGLSTVSQRRVLWSVI